VVGLELSSTIEIWEGIAGRCPDIPPDRNPHHLPGRPRTLPYPAKVRSSSGLTYIHICRSYVHTSRGIVFES